MKSGAPTTLIWVAAMLCPLWVHGECSLTISAAAIDLGGPVSKSPGSTAFPDYRQLGYARGGFLTVVCPAERPAAQLVFRNIAGLGGRLLRWDASQPKAAILMVVRHATADGAGISVSAGTGPQLTSLDIVQDGTVLTLRPAPPATGARVFTVAFEVTGFIEADYAAGGRTSFTWRPQVTLLDP